MTHFTLNVAYQIKQHRKFGKEILKIPAKKQRKIYQVLTGMRDNPSSLPPNTEPLKGFKGVYRTRLGDIRLIYQIDHDQEVIKALLVDFRGNVYRLVNRLLG